MSTESELINSGDFQPPYHQHRILDFLLQDISTTCMLVLIVLELSIEFEDGSRCISTKSIAQWLGVDPKTIRRALTTLIEEDYISVTDYMGIPRYQILHDTPDEGMLPGELET